MHIFCSLLLLLLFKYKTVIGIITCSPAQQKIKFAAANELQKMKKKESSKKKTAQFLKPGPSKKLFAHQSRAACTEPVNESAAFEHQKIVIFQNIKICG